MGSVGDMLGTIGGVVTGVTADYAIRALEALAALSGGEVKSPK